MTFIATQRRQIVSTVGLAILFLAAISAMHYGLVEASGMALACLPPLLAGTAISLFKRWPAMATMTMVGGLSLLGLGGAHGADGTFLLWGLALVLLLASLMRIRWLLPAAIAPVGAYLLIGIWVASGVVHQGPRLVLAIGAAWLVGAVLLVWRGAQSNVLRDANLGLINALAATVLLVVTQSAAAPLCAIAGALVLAQGVLMERLAGKRHVGASLLQLFGLMGLSLAGYLVWGALGLALGLSLVAIALYLAGRAQSDALLDHAALWVALPQALLVAVSHPALQGMSSAAWHHWSLVALALGAQMLWLLRAPRPANRHASISWVLPPLAALLALCAVSTEIALFVPWVPALTLLWTLAGAALWLMGERLPGLRIAGGIAASGALVKLLVWDWPHLGPSARVILLMVVGTTMLVTPLLSLPVLKPARSS